MRNLRVIGIAALTMAGSAVAYWLTSAPAVPTLDEYLSISSDRSLAPVDYKIDAASAACGKVRIVFNPKLNDVAAAEPGFVIINPKFFYPLPGSIRKYVFGHECGHQLHGPSEEAADCYAVTRGEAQGWLDAIGVQGICDFWKNNPGDSKHLPGPARCELMKRCFANAKASKG